MAPSGERIKLILSKLEDVISAYDEDCRLQERRRLERPEKESGQAAMPQAPPIEESTISKVQQQPPPRQSLPSRESSGPTPRPTTPGSAFCRRQQRRGLLGRLLRQCLPVGSGDGRSKIQVPLGWASAVTFNWRRRSSNSSAAAAAATAASTSIGNADSLTGEGRGVRPLRLRKRLRKGLGIGHEPVVLIGRRARHSTVLMARARRLRRSLPAKLRRQLEGFGDSQEQEAEDDVASDVEISNAGKMMAPPVCVPSSSVETNADLVESSVTDESPARATCVQDSEQASLVLATPQRRELDAEVRKIEEEIKNVRQQLEQPDSESPFAPTPPPPQRPAQRLLITSSGLDPAEVAKLRQLCEIHSDCCVYQARFQFDPELHTNHVIIRESSSVPRVSERTLKYFQALVSGAWLLSFDWVSESLAAGSLLPESAFEIQGDLSCGVNHLGPARSRGGRARCPGPSRLLEQFCIAPVGEFVNMPTFALQTLVQQCGGQFAASPESLPRRQASGRLSVAVADQDDAKFSESRCRSIAASGDIIVLNRDWLLDSISKFRVQQLHSSEYCITPDCSVAMEIVTRQRIRLPWLDDI